MRLSIPPSLLLQLQLLLLTLPGINYMMWRSMSWSFFRQPPSQPSGMFTAATILFFFFLTRGQQLASGPPILSISILPCTTQSPQLFLGKWPILGASGRRNQPVAPKSAKLGFGDRDSAICCLLSKTGASQYHAQMSILIELCSGPTGLCRSFPERRKYYVDETWTWSIFCPRLSKPS